MITSSARASRIPSHYHQRTQQESRAVSHSLPFSAHSSFLQFKPLPSKNTTANPRSLSFHRKYSLAPVSAVPVVHCRGRQVGRGVIDQVVQSRNTSPSLVVGPHFDTRTTVPSEDDAASAAPGMSAVLLTSSLVSLHMANPRLMIRIPHTVVAQIAALYTAIRYHDTLAHHVQSECPRSR